jgi:hypothetical protein
MREILWQVPAYRRYFRVEFAANGNPRRPGGQRRGDDHDQHRPSESKTWFPSGEALAVKRVWSERSLWLRWVFANAVGEALGLGMTALIGATIVSSLEGGTSALATLALAAIAVLAGTFVEGTVVGTAQWWALSGPLPGMQWRTWAVATGVGAFLAWLLGMVPSTVLSLGAGSGGASSAPTEPSNMVVLGLAFLMGLVLGPVLGFAQWLVLRRFVSHAALWMPANALAWAFGMAVIFASIDPAISGGFGLLSVVILGLTLACAGAVVGAIHGLALVWLLRSSE